MTVGWETIQVDGSPMRAYLGVPDGPGPHPGILVAQHAGGVDEQMQDTVHRLFRRGYIAISPELYHRQDPKVDRKEKPQILRGKEIVADLNACIARLKKLPVGPIGIVGYCMGGRVVYLAAAEIPELKAAAMFYGGNIFKPYADGVVPFDGTPKIGCPLIGFSGADDANPSPEAMRKIDAELTKLGKPHEFHLYREAGHAFHNFIEERYRDRAARGSWSELVAFFDYHLKGVR